MMREMTADTPASSLSTHAIDSSGRLLEALRLRHLRMLGARRLAVCLTGDRGRPYGKRRSA